MSPSSGTFSVAVGGQEWVDAEPVCTSTIKKNGWPCDQPPRPNKRTCFGHRNDEE